MKSVIFARNSPNHGGIPGEKILAKKRKKFLTNGFFVCIIIHVAEVRSTSEDMGA